MRLPQERADVEDSPYIGPFTTQRAAQTALADELAILQINGPFPPRRSRANSFSDCWTPARSRPGSSPREANRLASRRSPSHPGCPCYGGNLRPSGAEVTVEEVGGCLGGLADVWFSVIEVDVLVDVHPEDLLAAGLALVEFPSQLG